MLLGKSLRRLRAFVFPLPTTSSLSRSSAAPFPGRGLESLRSPPRRRVVVPAPACDSRPAHLAAAPTVPPIAECYESPRDSAAPTRPSVRVRRPCSANGTVGVVGGRESRSAGPSRGEGQTTHPPPPHAPRIAAMSLVRQNFHEECEDALNKQINLELYASYVYLSMVSWRIDRAGFRSASPCLPLPSPYPRSIETTPRVYVHLSSSPPPPLLPAPPRSA